jgi:hypothetical protein
MRISLFGKSKSIALNKLYNKKLNEKLTYIETTFGLTTP